MTYLEHLRGLTIPGTFTDEEMLDAEEALWGETVFCSICDAPGHGQPGYGPCPVYEENPWHAMRMEDEEMRVGGWF